MWIPARDRWGGAGEEEGQIDLDLDDDDEDEKIAKSTGGVTRFEDAGSKGSLVRLARPRAETGQSANGPKPAMTFYHFRHERAT